MALSVSFVGIAGIYARTAADSHRTQSRIIGENVEERRPMVV
jgi:hypothetical protein